MDINNNTTQPEIPEEPKKEKQDFSNEQQWAEILGMKFDPQDAQRASTPPPYQPGDEQSPVAQDAPHQPYYTNPVPVYGQPAPSGFQSQPAFDSPQNSEPMPPTFLVWAIISTICCCLPAGVVAIIFSANVSSKYYARDFEGARKASYRAQWWIIISIVLGIIVNSLYVPLSLLVS